MKQGPSSEAFSYSASQEILFLLWNLKVQYHGQNSLPLVPVPMCCVPCPSHPLWFHHCDNIWFSL